MDKLGNALMPSLFAKPLINPLLLFLGVWGCVIVGFQFDVSRVLLPIPMEFGIWLLVTAIVAVGGFLCSLYLPAHNVQPIPPIQRSHHQLLHLMVKVMFVVIFLVLFLTIVVSGGIPFLWYLNDGDKGYTDFGISSVTGFFNSLLLFVGTLCFWLLVRKQSTKFSNFVLATSLVIPVFTIHRYTLMTLLAQFGSIYCGANLRRNYRQILFVGGLLALGATSFELIGDLRSGSSNLRASASLDPDYDWLPNWAVWLYMYFTTPLNNFMHAATYFYIDRTNGATTVAALTPTVVRTMIWGPNVFDWDQYLVTSTFNVYCYAFPPYVDFGWPGVLLMTFVLMALSGWAFKMFLTRCSLYDLMMLSVFNQILLLSIFTNGLFTLTILFELLLLFLFRGFFISIRALECAGSA